MIENGVCWLQRAFAFSNCTKYRLTGEDKFGETRLRNEGSRFDTLALQFSPIGSLSGSKKIDTDKELYQIFTEKLLRFPVDSDLNHRPLESPSSLLWTNTVDIYSELLILHVKKMISRTDELLLFSSVGALVCLCCFLMFIIFHSYCRRFLSLWSALLFVEWLFFLFLETWEFLYLLC